MEEEWFKNWFDTTYYHTLYQNRNDDEAKIFIENLLRFLSPKKNAQFLDIACGKGRHANQIQTHAHLVTGYDLSEESIEEAKKMERLGLSFYVHDMRNLFRTNYFDYALNLFTSFGYFNTARDEQNAISSASKSLKKGGVFTLDFLNKHKVTSTLIPQETKTIDGITFHITRFIKNNRVHKQINFFADGQENQYTEKVKLLTLSDFEKYFSFAGLEIKHVFGDYDLSPYIETSNRLILIATKK
ncbi:MAG: ubiquinone/menaquinone biosynthesis C-methylase UbiE [Saprospiraceae bacterium]|jgi:ubiquinone/menaquinone biosynthesis C-methylase UbiE